MRVKFSPSLPNQSKNGRGMTRRQNKKYLWIGLNCLISFVSLFVVAFTGILHKIPNDTFITIMLLARFMAGLGAGIFFFWLGLFPHITSKLYKIAPEEIRNSFILLPRLDD